MKFLSGILLLGAVVECTPQFGGMGGGTQLPLVSRKDVQPKYRATAKRQILSYGPFSLAGLDEKKPPGGMAMDRKGQAGSWTINTKNGLCASCTVLSVRILFHNPDGTPAKPVNGFYVHHMLAFDRSKQTKVPIGSDGLPNFPWQPFTDRGEDSGDTDTVFTTPDGKFNSGFHFKNPNIMIQYDLVNYNKEKRDVFLDLEIEYVDGLQGKDAGHVMKSVQGTPKVSQTGALTTKSKNIPITEDATIVWARGHIHSGGTEVILTVNGKDICTSKPTYDKEGVITTMSICPTPIPLKKGDTLALRGTYDLTKHDLRKATDGSKTGSKGQFGLGSDTMIMWALSYAYDR